MYRLLLFLAFLAAITQGAVGQGLEQTLSEKVMRDYHLDPEYSKITIHHMGLSHQDVTGLEVRAYPLTQSEPRGIFSMRVEIYNDTTLLEKGSVTLYVRQMADLLVPGRDIKRNESLSLDMFVVKRIDVTSLTESLLSDPMSIEGCRARQNLPAGRCVFLTKIEKIPDVASGEQVIMIGLANLFEVKAKGIALENGQIGETIKIRNVDSRKVVMGRVTGPGAVAVAL